MRRLRLKADGRIVEIRDGREMPLAPSQNPPAYALRHARPNQSRQRRETPPVPQVRELRLRAQLTQAEFATRLCVPLETIRNWEQGKRMPRGPALALLAVIAHAPDTVFAALAEDTAKV